MIKEIEEMGTTERALGRGTRPELTQDLVQSWIGNLTLYEECVGGEKLKHYK